VPPIHDKVVVITGASSGLGRATAIAFAREGARLVLAARRREALEETARLCDADALAVVSDVTVEEDVRRLAGAALERHGRIDVWINNAGVTLFALLEDGPMEEHRRVVETNLFGAMHAARAVVPIFRRQRRGTLINVGSVVSRVGQPFVPSYAISKFAVRGLTETLRLALADEPDVHVCSIEPYAIDTPHFESGANRIGHPAHAMAPVQSPEKIARAIVALARRPVREVHVPRVAPLLSAARWLMPRPVERIVLHMLARWHFAPGDEPRTSGNLFLPPRQPAAVHGTRPPRIGGLRLAAWVAGELVRMAVRGARRGPARLGAAT
jgi:NAD(P)-dependent dehydrogenase (short-subunit alcohol dehydrogenase family)